MDSPVINIIGSRCRPEEEAKFNEWYNNTHIPMLMRYEGLKAVERFKILVENPDYSTYIAVYHYDNLKGLEERAKSPSSAEAAAEVKTTWPEGLDIRWRVSYIEHKKWSTPGASQLSTNTVIHIVGVNGPAPEKDAEFNEWYDKTHVPWLMKTGTISQSARYQITQPNNVSLTNLKALIKDYPTYLAVYYFANQKKYEEFSDHPERLAAIKELDEHWPNGIGRMWWVQYQLIKGWKR